MKNKNEKLFFQFYKAIELAFKPCIDKHSYKKSNCKKVRIFSYGDRKNIIKCTNQLCIFIESNYSDIQKIKEININHIRSFLEYKAEYCTKNTISNYKYCIRKLEKMVKEYLYLNVKYIDSKMKINTKKDYLRNIEMREKDIRVLLEECKKSRSKAVLGIELTVMFGLRVAEISKIKGKDINLENLYVHIHESKGKRSRNIEIDTLGKLDICNRIKEVISDNERVCELKEDSINTVIRRMLIKNNITKYKNCKTGVHAIRKYYAKRSYENNLVKLKNEKCAWDETSKELGHNEGRKVLKNTYVKY